MATGSGSPDARRDLGARIDRMPFTRWHIGVTGILGSARFFDALDTMSLAFVLPVLVSLWRLTPTQAGVLISASFLGQALGGVGGGLLAEKFGRLPVVRLCLTVMACASVACAFSSSYTILLVLRLVQGIGIGGEGPITAAYMNEVCPARHRNKAIVALQLIFATGVVFTSFVALWIIPRFGWRVLFMVGGLPIASALILRWLPESPRWLAAMGRLGEAESSVTSIESYVNAPQIVSAASVEEPVAAAAPAAQHVRPPTPSLRALLGPALLRPTLSAWIVAFCAALVSLGLLGWMPTIYQQVFSLPVAVALRYSAVSAGTSLGGAMLAIVVIDRMGPKKAMTYALAAVAVVAGLIAVMRESMGPVAVAASVAVVFAFIATPMTGLFAYAPELYPTHLRAFGVGVATSWSRIAAIIVPTIVGMLLSRGGLGAVFVFFSGAAAVGAVSIAWLGIHTGVHRATKRGAESHAFGVGRL